MPVPTDTLWNIRRLNRVFALCALAMLGALIWAVVQDHSRAWRSIQQDGKTWETALLEEKIRQLEPLPGQESRQQIAGLQKQVNALKPGGMAGRLSTVIRRTPLLQFINPAESVRQVVIGDVLTDMTFAKIPTTDRCMTCHVHIDQREFEPEKIIAFLELQVARQRNYGQEAAAAMPEFWHLWGRKLLSDASLAITASRVNAIVAVAGKRIEGNWYNKSATTRPSLLEPAVRDQQDHNVAQLLQSMMKGAAGERSQVLAHVMQTRELLKAELPPREFHDLLERYRRALTAEVNIQRRRLGLDPLDASPVQLAHSDLNLYADAKSPHAVDTVGCTSCHDGAGQETDFVRAAHTPRQIWVDQQTGEPVLAQQFLKAPSDTAGDGSAATYVDAISGQNPFHLSPSAFRLATATYADPISGKKGWAIPQSQYWAGKYEGGAGTSFQSVNELWDRPMRGEECVQANCARCHNSIDDVRERAPVLYQGRVLYAKLGCANCHQTDSIAEDDRVKRGADLRNVASKLSPGFVNRWIWSPRGFRPSTLMPDFFMLDNNSSTEEIRRTHQEARAMTEYLMVSSNPTWTAAHPLPANATGDAAQGRKLFNSLGCLGCHSNLNEVGEKWITTDLTKRLAMDPMAAQAKFRAMTYTQRQQYALENFGEDASPAQQPKYTEGSPKPIFVRHAPELSGIGEKLTAGRSLEAARAWLFDWLVDPRHYSSDTRMPRLRLDDQQAIDLAAYLLKQHRDNVSTSAGVAQGTSSLGFLGSHLAPHRADDSGEEFPVDAAKVTELTTVFLTSQYGPAVASRHASDPQEILTRATDALEAVCVSRLAAADESSKDLPSDRQNPVARAQAAKLASGLTPEQQQLVFLGAKLIVHYGCMNCHAINGMENLPTGASNLSDWGQKRASMLDFGNLDARTAPHTRDGFLNQKLNDSRSFDRGRTQLEPTSSDPGKPYEKLKMPQYALNERQRQALATFVLSNRDRNISQEMLARTNDDTATQIARGRRISGRLYCVGCHETEGTFPPIRQNFPADLWMTHTPPSLRGEGNKVQPNWLFAFLHNVEPLRPLIAADSLRMPSFSLNDDQTTALVAYFAAISNRESRHLKEDLTAVDRYVQRARQATTHPDLPPGRVTHFASSLFPSPWYSGGGSGWGLPGTNGVFSPTPALPRSTRGEGAFAGRPTLARR